MVWWSKIHNKFVESHLQLRRLVYETFFAIVLALMWLIHYAKDSTQSENVETMHFLKWGTALALM